MAKPTFPVNEILPGVEIQSVTGSPLVQVCLALASWAKEIQVEPKVEVQEMNPAELGSLAQAC